MARSGASADEAWMLEACAQAEKGLGRTAPNPAVGCVIVSGGRAVAWGYHRRAGLAHAEIEALRRAAGRARGATVYVTLEPCCHHGKTPPCIESLIEAGVSRVVVGVRDPNPAVRGRGLRALRSAGIRVDVGVAEAECSRLIRGFSHWITTGKPWLHLKLAASLDGRIASVSGESKWISGPASRKLVQSMRARSDAVIVGIGTLLADDPRLTCRVRGGRDPLRVVLDSGLRTPIDARVVTGRGEALIVGSPKASARRRARLQAAGAEVISLDTRGARGWTRLMKALGERGFHEVLLEGGAKVAASAVRCRMVNELTIFYNPRLIGGDGVPMLDSLGIRQPDRAVRLETGECFRSGEDFVWRGTLA